MAIHRKVSEEELKRLNSEEYTAEYTRWPMLMTAIWEASTEESANNYIKEYRRRELINTLKG